MANWFYDRKRVFSQSYLLGRFVRNAQRPSKVPFFIGKNGLNLAWWIGPFSFDLQISSAPFPFSLEGEG
jgi:hypothetical protein